MMIHISQTSQSYLVPEKKMVIFLKHAGVTESRYWHEYSWILSGCHEAYSVARTASTLAGTHADKAALREFDSPLEQHVMCRLLAMAVFKTMTRKVFGVDTLNFGRVDH